MKPYRKYYVEGKKIELQTDFIYMVEPLWKFLFAIYDGGPIMKKRPQKAKAPKQQEIQIKSFHQSNFSDFSDAMPQFGSSFHFFSPLKTKMSVESDSNTTRPSSSMSALTGSA